MNTSSASPPPTASPAESELLVGGQALIEGVMMRSPGAYGIAVRRPDGSLALQRGKVFPLGKKYPFLKLPVLRGVAVLFQSLFIGIQALNFSALEAGVEKPEDAKKETSGWAVAASMAMGLGLGVLVFLLVPLWLTQLAEKHVFGSMPNLAFNLFDGALRGIFFLGYIVAISRMKDIHRVFQYHGAEHKVVFAWEARGPLTVDAARVQSRLHPRCGTSFLLFVLLVSIVLFALIPKSAPFLVKFGGRLVLVPFIAGLSYEVLRLTAKKANSPVFAFLVAPGLMLQKITTQEPTDDMLAVAIAALEEALREDGLMPEAELQAAISDTEEAPALA
ncbi:MAG TPA: DUF1385 domain-containing protein [Thermoanaerobaculia bacterium]|jgi:uncharacterized protein YqhQ|nr:DUF1385 domain-containing protein [Thermoanaerobaculia bacterium]